MVFIHVPTVNMSYLAKFAYWEACWLTPEVLYLTAGNFAWEWISTVSWCTWIVVWHCRFIRELCLCSAFNFNSLHTCICDGELLQLTVKHTQCCGQFRALHHKIECIFTNYWQSWMSLL